MIMMREGTTLSVAPRVQVADLQPGWPMIVDEGSCFDGVNSLIKHTRRMNKMVLLAVACRMVTVSRSPRVFSHFVYFPRKINGASIHPSTVRLRYTNDFYYRTYGQAGTGVENLAAFARRLASCCERGNGYFLYE
jgi:hypothetical protein